MRWRPSSPKDLYEALVANMSTGRREHISAGSLELEGTDRTVAQATAIAVASKKIEPNMPLPVEVTNEHSPAVFTT
jgi:hypothetical protein